MDFIDHLRHADYAGHSAFWTTLAFFVAGPPYFYGSDVAGLFGLAGALARW